MAVGIAVKVAATEVPSTLAAAVAVAGTSGVLVAVGLGGAVGAGVAVSEGVGSAVGVGVGAGVSVGVGVAVGVGDIGGVAVRLSVTAKSAAACISATISAPIPVRVSLLVAAFRLEASGTGVSTRILVAG